MHRRSFLTTGASVLVAACVPGPLANSKEAGMSDFPFELVPVPGKSALAELTRLRSAGRGSPVIVGDSEFLGSLADALKSPEDTRPPAEILAAARALMHPRSMESLRAGEMKRLLESLSRREDKDLPEFRDADDGGRRIPKAE